MKFSHEFHDLSTHQAAEVWQHRKRVLCVTSGLQWYNITIKFLEGSFHTIHWPVTWDNFSFHQTKHCSYDPGNSRLFMMPTLSWLPWSQWDHAVPEAMTKLASWRLSVSSGFAPSLTLNPKFSLCKVNGKWLGTISKTYELSNLRALKFLHLNKIHICQCMGKIFYVEFRRVPL